MAMFEDNSRDLFFSALSEARRNGLSDGQIARNFLALLSGYDFPKHIYKPDPNLKAVIAEYKQWCQDLIDAEETNNRPQLTVLKARAGTLLEELAFLAFNCLEGKESIKSFQSYSAQHDLVISGSVPNWFSLVEMLHLPQESRTFVIEAKNIQDKVR